MLIKLDNGNLILTKENSELKSNHKSQLKAWGFEDKGVTLVNGDYKDEILIKLISYFDNRKIQYKLDELIIKKIARCSF